MEPVALGGRRALRQDARRRRARSGGRAGGATGQLVRDAPRGPRSVRERGASAAAGRAARSDAGRAGGDGRLPHGASSEDAGDDRPDRARPPRQGQADAAAHQHRPRRHRRRGRAGRGTRGGTDRGRVARRVRDRAHHRVTAVRAGAGGRDTAPGRVDRRGPGQGRPDDRRAGRARARGRLRALCGQRRRERGQRDRAAVPPAGGAAGRAVQRGSPMASPTSST